MVESLVNVAWTLIEGGEESHAFFVWDDHECQKSTWGIFAPGLPIVATIYGKTWQDLIDAIKKDPALPKGNYFIRRKTSLRPRHHPNLLEGLDYGLIKKRAND
jgi:hypothetical protein